jgi:hypothetical protein
MINAIVGIHIHIQLRDVLLRNNGVRTRDDKLKEKRKQHMGQWGCMHTVVTQQQWDHNVDK